MKCQLLAIEEVFKLLTDEFKLQQIKTAQKSGTKTKKSAVVGPSSYSSNEQLHLVDGCSTVPCSSSDIAKANKASSCNGHASAGECLNQNVFFLSPVLDYFVIDDDYSIKLLVNHDDTWSRGTPEEPRRLEFTCGAHNTSEEILQKVFLDLLTTEAIAHNEGKINPLGGLRAENVRLRITRPRCANCAFALPLKMACNFALIAFCCFVPAIVRPVLFFSTTPALRFCCVVLCCFLRPFLRGLSLSLFVHGIYGSCV
ncbi:hypothetical protein niasHT_037889 [Heterodera trifolii]|uniref:Uncharacterized protein n=1 Tax=Heterodera trifolii TaxID=157864 RepID=A0ABD2IH76_9BILA